MLTWQRACVAPFLACFFRASQGECMYSVIRGKVDITAQQPDRLPPSAISEAVRLARSMSHHVATMGEGDVFGERALMAGERRNATVRCASETCELAVLRKKDFVQLMKHAPEVGGSATWKLDHVVLGWRVCLAVHRAVPA